jgi:hypothetical protein
MRATLCGAMKSGAMHRGCRCAAGGGSGICVRRRAAWRALMLARRTLPSFCANARTIVALLSCLRAACAYARGGRKLR